MAIYKNKASQKLAVYAHDTSADAPKTGDAANITAQISLDGGSTNATNDTNPTELSSTNAKGVYIFDLTQGESNADMVILSAVSSTSNISIEPVIAYTEPQIRLADNRNGDAIAGAASIWITTAGVPTFYATPEAAQTAASSGDMIMCMASAALSGSGLGKAGVNWYFGPGVTITNANGPVWIGTSISYNVYGHGRFIASADECISLTTPGRVNIQGSYFSPGGAGKALCKVTTGSGTGDYYVNLEGELFIANSYDLFWLLGDGQGTIHFTAKGHRGRTGGNLVEFGADDDEATHADVLIDIDSLEMTTAGAMVNAQGSTGHCAIESKRLVGPMGGSYTTLLASTNAAFSLTVTTTTLQAAGQTGAANPVTINGATIDTRGATVDSLTLDHNGYVLNNCRIISDDGATDSVSGTSGVTLTVGRSFTTNKGVHSNITLDYQDSPDAIEAQETIATNLDAKISEIDAGGGADVNITEQDVEISS